LAALQCLPNARFDRPQSLSIAPDTGGKTLMPALGVLQIRKPSAGYPAAQWLGRAPRGRARQRVEAGGPQARSSLASQTYSDCHLKEPD
jgi:hypothetical protein